MSSYDVVSQNLNWHKKDRSTKYIKRSFVWFLNCLFRWSRLVLVKKRGKLHEVLALSTSGGHHECFWVQLCTLTFMILNNISLLVDHPPIWSIENTFWSLAQVVHWPFFSPWAAIHVTPSPLWRHVSTLCLCCKKVGGVSIAPKLKVGCWGVVRPFPHRA